MIDGCDVYDYLIDLPTKSAPKAESSQGGIDMNVLLGGGVVSSHLKEKHIQLMKANSTQLTWKLGSIHILEGELELLLLKYHSDIIHWFIGFSSVKLGNLLYQLGPECSPSTIQSPDAGSEFIPSYIEVTSSDTTFVNQRPISDTELLALQVGFEPSVYVSEEPTCVCVHVLILMHMYVCTRVGSRVFTQ